MHSKDNDNNFAEQIEGWDGLEGLTEQQIADTIAAPNVPRHIRRQLEQDGFLMDSFWKSVSKASFDLVRQYKEKVRVQHIGKWRSSTHR